MSRAQVLATAEAAARGARGLAEDGGSAQGEAARQVRDQDAAAQGRSQAWSDALRSSQERAGEAGPGSFRCTRCEERLEQDLCRYGAFVCSRFLETVLMTSSLSANQAWSQLSGRINATMAKIREVESQTMQLLISRVRRPSHPLSSIAR